MKRIYLASLFIACAFSTNVNAKIIVDCPESSRSYGYIYDSSCVACPSGFHNTPKGKCVKCDSAKEYWTGKGCQVCPENATCNGDNFTCKAGYIKKGDTCEASCPKGQILFKGECVVCVNDKVSNAVDTGCSSAKPSCNGAQGKSGTACTVASKTCTTKQYLVHNTCTECPANATCNGTQATCNKGYSNIVKEVGNKVICHSSAETACKTNQYLVNNKCVACPEYASCDGRSAKCLSKFAKKTDARGAVICEIELPIPIFVCRDSAVGSNIDEGCTASKPICRTVIKNKNNGSRAIGDQCVAFEAVCTKNQYLVNSKCTACPANATCDGKTFTCKSGYSKSENVCIKDAVNQSCKKTEYMSENKCYPCPQNATCNGELLGVKCKQGYTDVYDGRFGKIICEKAEVTCTKKQYLVNDKCTACPVNATCNGKTATCKKGMVSTVKNGKVSCLVKKCQQGSHDSVAWIRNRYKNCANCRSESIKAGACSKNKKAHNHYYCDCDC